MQNRPDWQKTGSQHVWMPYTQMKTALPPLPVERTEGCYIILADGRRLLDAISSWWTACHGYNHPHIVGAVEKQLHKMPHVMFGGLQHEPALQLATRLAALLPGDLNRVFFSDSGSVSVEVALKIAVQFWLNRQRPGKTRFVCFQDSYHGDTVGAMSVCDPVDGLHAHFKGFVLEQYPRPIPNTAEEFAELGRFLQDKRDMLAGVIIEPLVQAACGMRFHSPRQLAGIARQTRRHDLLFIADEIATGFGRTGSMFACQQAEIIPDIICLGKGLTGGTMGMAATVARDEIFAAFYSDEPQAALMHGPSFMANPLACAAANASLDLFEREPRLEQAKHIERLFRDQLEQLRQHPFVKDVRCLGAIGVVHCEANLDKTRVMELAIERGIWLRSLRDVIYLMPPLIVSDEEIHSMCQAVSEIVEHLAKQKLVHL